MAFRILLFINVLLCIGLGILWMDETGQIRYQRWQPPLPLRPDLIVAAESDSSTATNPAKFLAILDQPMFAPDRLPPPPREAQSPLPATPDVLANFQVVGVYRSGGVDGVIGRTEGKAQKLAVGEKLGGWVLEMVDGREAVFARESEKKRVSMVPIHLRRPTVPSGSSSPSGIATVAGPPLHDIEHERQMREEATRENTRRQNEIRAKAGLLPIRD